MCIIRLFFAFLGNKVLIFNIILFVSTTSLLAQPFAGGSGTQADPYQVATAVQLDSVRNYGTIANTYFIQTANIDLNVAPYNTGSGWEPIANFNGTYDGGAYTITGLFINRGSTDNVGLFATLDGVITKLILSAPVVTGNSNVGALVGTVIEGTNGMDSDITQVAIQGGSVTANGSNGGGIAGTNGDNIIDCYASTRVIGTGPGPYGGLAGTLIINARIRDSYSVGVVTGTLSGGLVGSLASGARAFESYYNTDSTATSPGEGTGLATSQMYQQSSFDSDFDFTSTWVMFNEGSEFPELQIFANPSLLFAGGSGTQADPLLVATAGHLNNVRRFPTLYFQQTADIDLNVFPYNIGEGWTPIPIFAGKYNGNGHTISNLYINPTTTQDYLGLIAQLSGSAINNSFINDLTLLNPSVTNGNRVGSLAGTIVHVELTNVRIIGGSTTGESAAGGVIGGSSQTSRINKCSAIGMTVTTNGTAAGTHAGGLIGNGFAILVTNSYAANTIQGGAASGGLVGEAFGTITNSYSASVVTGPGMVGGLVGDAPTLVNATNSYYNSDSTSAATVFGDSLTTAQMRQRASFTGWDFDTHWFIDEGVSFPGLLENKGNFLNITGDEGWRMLASPLQSRSIGTLLNSLWTQGFTGSDGPDGNSNVYIWNESTRNWAAPSDTSLVPSAGTGFLMYVYSDDNSDGSPEGFPKRLSPTGNAITGQQSINLSYTSTGSSADDGWNLVGNPYPTTINWDAGRGWIRQNMDQAFYVWSDSENNGNGAYLTWNTLGMGTKGDGLIAPWQGFWVKANAASPQVVFTDTVRNAGGALLKQAKPVIPKIDLELEGNGLSSRAIVLFHEQAERGKDPLDAYKLQSLSPDYLLLGTAINGLETMDIQALPYSEEPMELDLVIQGSNLNGEHTLQWTPEHLPEEWQLEILDSKTGEVYPLEEPGAFSFVMDSSSASKRNKVTKLATPTSPIQPLAKVRKDTSRFKLTIRSATLTSQEPDAAVPDRVELLQNYPNPFNPVTTINYSIPEQSRVRLEVFDMLGRKVATLLNERVEVGYHQVRFDARNLASGVYIYRLQAGDKTITKKLTLIK